MIFADSLPFAKSFFSVLKLPASSISLLTRLVACIAGLHSASAAAAT